MKNGSVTTYSSEIFIIYDSIQTVAVSYSFSSIKMSISYYQISTLSSNPNAVDSYIDDNVLVFICKEYFQCVE